MRINKYLASAGVASRRKCEEFVTMGAVAVNGVVVRDLATDVLASDKVTVRGKAVTPAVDKVYVIMNKPKDVVCTCSDERGRKTVLDILPHAVKGARLFPVGRLDFTSEGLLILTNDGEFTRSVTHPSSKIEKVYVATLEKKFDRRDAEKLETGVDIDGEMTLPAKVRVIGKDPLRGDIVEIVITQGRNRQVRRMFYAIGYNVHALTRVRIGRLDLGDLKVGECRVLDCPPLV